MQYLYLRKGKRGNYTNIILPKPKYDLKNNKSDLKHKTSIKEKIKKYKHKHFKRNAIKYILSNVIIVVQLLGKEMIHLALAS